MSDAQAYDEHPYTGYAYWFTHPDHLGVVGALHGLDTAPSDRCRVLELGCGDGGNLIPLAAALPTSQFVGVDLSEAHIRAGTDLVGRLGLSNVELVEGDVAALEVTGAFDYIIAHGLFSWVPDDTRAAVLDLVQRALAPHGVAVVSYNAYPGWHDEAPVRRLMEFHTRPVAGAADKVRQARGIADWHCRRMVEVFGDERKAMMERVLGVVEGASDTLVRHDYLSEHHQPFYFEDFMARARAHGLEFLANARPGKLRLGNFEPEVADMLRRVADPVRRQQYMDFFAHTRFRETLLCHAGPAIDRDAAPRTRFEALAVESRLDQDVWAPETRDAEAITVEAPAGAVAIAGAPLRIALSVLQRQAPRALPLRELFEATLPELTAQGADGGLAETEEGRDRLFTMLIGELVALYHVEIVHLWRTPPPVARALSPRPYAPPLQRALAAAGGSVPTLTHRQLPMVDAARALLADLDGARDLEALRAAHGPDAEAIAEALRAAGFLADTA